MSKIEQKAEWDGNKTSVTEKTRVSLPLPMQISVYIFLIIITGTTVAYYFDLRGTDKDLKNVTITLNDETKRLKDEKLDKTTYESDKKLGDKDKDEINRRLGLIMKKLGIEDYGQEVKK